MDIINRIIRISNTYYNQGLERAQVRDLSGAVESLRKSLKFYKMNTSARNLLGLVYFEMGETVDAISQWVISKHLQPENNSAEMYLSAVQTNGNKLDSLNQTIKKYNQALTYCRQGSKDLAVIQLKKVLNLNPKLVKGHQLLALLYMEEGKYDLAKKSLRNAGRIDGNNTTTLRYLREVNKQLHGEQPSKKSSQMEKEELIAYQSGNETIIHPANFKDNSALGTILNMVLGLVIGILITCFLVVPSVRQSSVREANESVREANDTITTKNQTIKTLESQVESLTTQIETMENENVNSQGVMTIYEQLLVAYDAYLNQDYINAGIALENVDASQLVGKASEVYESISGNINAEYIQTLYQQANTAYNNEDYTEAVENYQKVIKINESYDDWNAIYYLAQSYRKMEDTNQAITYYQKLIQEIPGTERAREAEHYLEELQQEPAQ